jgi:hypothetical protein
MIIIKIIIFPKLYDNYMQNFSIINENLCNKEHYRITKAITTVFNFNVIK